MSTKYKHSHEVPTAVLAKRLDELSDAVRMPGEERDRELTMRIPAEVDRDADLVLCEAATRLTALAAQVESLRTACQIAFQTPLDEHYSKGVNVALCHAIESTAETSLALLKAQWQAEALEEAARDYSEHGIDGGNGEWDSAWHAAFELLAFLAAELRRQAEEVGNGKG